MSTRRTDTAILIDSGNSRIKWATSTADDELGTPQVVVRARWPTPEFIDALRQSPHRVLVANVAGAVTAQTIRSAVRDIGGIEPEFVVVEAHAAGVTNAYAQPRRLGVDRWVAMIGARGQCASLCCVVDVGTAMTIDAVDATGLHLGGLIVPGPDLMISSLLAGTSDLAEFSVDGDETLHLFADNTLGAIRQGSVQALAALVHRCMQRLTREHGEAALLLTGGAADRIADLVDWPVRRVPDLVLRGLLILLRVS